MRVKLGGLLPLPQIDVLLQDFRYGARLVRRAPQLTAAIVLTLALGTGLNSVAFSFFNGLLFRANVSHDPASFVRVYAQRSGDWRPDPHGLPTMLTLEEVDAIRAQSTTLSAVTAFRWATFALRDGVAANLRGLFVSCNFLSAHTRGMRLGRGFEDADCAVPGRPPVAILSERAWNIWFDREAAIVGRTIDVNNRSLTVIGVVSDEAFGPGAYMVFVPYTMQPLLQPPDDYFRAPAHRHAWLNLSGRLAPGKTAREAQAEIDAIVTNLDRLHPGGTTDVLVTNGALIAEPGRARTIVGLVLTSTTLVMLLVCANVTTLLLSRAEARRHEMALRLALGAGRARLAMQLMVEGSVPALAAAVAGLGLAAYLPGRLAQMLAGVPLSVSFEPDWGVFAYTCAVALLAGCLAAVSPARASLRFRLADGLRATGRQDGSSHSRTGRREYLIAHQVAISLALLVAMGLVWQAQDRLRTPNASYDPGRIMVTPLDLARVHYSGEQAAGFYSELFPRLEALAGTQSLAVSTSPPFRGGYTAQFAVDTGTGATMLTSVRAVSASYFQLLGLELVRGRVFSEWEAQSRVEPIPVVVSESLAQSLSGRVDTLERRLRLADGLDIRIVGVVADTSSVRLGESDGPVLYQPISAAGRWSRAPSVTRLSILLPVAGDPAPLAQAIHSEVQALDPRVVVTPETIAATIDREADGYQTVVTVTGVLAGLALCLSLVGIYGVTAFLVTQRTQEIGIRTALGARPHQIVALFIWSLRASLVIGLAAGALLAAVAGWWLQWARLLPAGEAANGPLAYAVALVLLVATAGIATLIPSLTAARADPWHALSGE